MEHVLTYTEACSMSGDQLCEVNAALDYYIELSKQQNKNKK